MSRPKWTETVEPQDQEKVAVAYKQMPDGSTRVVAAGTGVEAEKIIAQAQASGVQVRRNEDEVEQLLRSENEQGSNVPPEIYELMAVVINFAQEVNEQWLRENYEDSEY
ncbi:MAG: EscU/YscU/HrcU family type III secretion system export apparatus switch protein [Candidatus Eremiobacteraeota bacterium]|nr:EscU/YscU/HrcU family type III secretion system export apparatus switch protein [Candidatus Eremiobacteraeota bacterium]